MNVSQARAFVLRTGGSVEVIVGEIAQERAEFHLMYIYPAEKRVSVGWRPEISRHL